MKLLIKILLFVFVALVVNVNITSAAITFPNIQKATASFSFHNEVPKVIFKIVENDLANCCQNEQDLVDYINWNIGVEAVATKGVGKVKIPGTNPAKAPKGFEWRGKPGSTPGSKGGNWYSPKTAESLRPHLNHPKL